MPVMGGSRKRSRGNTEKADGTQLKGWNFIQEKILSHDEDMIADYADDIDTLLVFAGLFSAVLTAFLVVSVVLLQPDNSQASVQLLSILVLQNGAPPAMQPFLNDTAESLPTTIMFKPPTNVATINTLWFTSLVLSLAAALFGILAKQWCREYLRWHNTILPARNNILIRQVRFEAWDRWQVSSFIASIPALLEIALIIFLIGLPIFARTFSEASLTIVVSVAVALTLLGVIVLTVLPVFYRLCPFQTPTGWAFVHLAGPLRMAFWHLVKRVSVMSDWTFRHVITRIDEPHWSVVIWNRSRLKLRAKERLTDWRAYGLYSVEDPELSKLAPAASEIERACHAMPVDFDQAAIDAVQTSTLFRALTWVRLGSNDSSVHAAIQGSVPSIHATILTPVIAGKPQFLSAIHAICPTDVSAALQMVQPYFFDSVDGTLSFRGGPGSPFKPVDFLGTFVDTRERGLEEQHQAVCKAWASDSASLEVGHALIRADLSSLINDWLSLLPRWQEQARRDVSRRIVLLLCVLRVLPSQDTRQAAEDAGDHLTRPLAEILEEIYRKLAPHKSAYEDGLVSTVVEMCMLLGPVGFKFEREQAEKYNIKFNHGSLYDIARWKSPSVRECNLVTTWVKLSVDIYRNTIHDEDTNGRHLFVTSVTRVFQTMRLRIDNGKPVMNDSEPIAPMSELLSCMIDALRWSLVHSHRNCGAYVPLPWVKGIIECYQSARNCEHSRYKAPLQAIPLTGDSALRPTFHQMLRLLHTCLERNLLTDKTAASDWDWLITLIEDPRLPPVPADLLPEALAAVHQVPGDSNMTEPVESSTPDEKISSDDDLDSPEKNIPEWAWTPIGTPVELGARGEITVHLSAAANDPEASTDNDVVHIPGPSAIALEELPLPPSLSALLSPPEQSHSKLLQPAIVIADGSLHEGRVQDGAAALATPRQTPRAPQLEHDPATATERRLGLHHKLAIRSRSSPSTACDADFKVTEGCESYQPPPNLALLQPVSNAEPASVPESGSAADRAAADDADITGGHGAPQPSMSPSSQSSPPTTVHLADRGSPDPLRAARVVEIDSTDRDLEAGPRILSSVDDDQQRT